jgi:hypothetical protein
VHKLERQNLRGYMQALKLNVTQRAASVMLTALLVFPSFAFSQDPPTPPSQAPNYDSQSAPAAAPPSTGGWKRVGDPAAQTQSAPDNGVPMAAPPPGDPNMSAPNGYPTYGQPTGQPPYAQQQPNQAPDPNYRPMPNYPQQQSNYPPPQQQSYQQVPPVLTMPAGTFLTVRVNQLLSSDRNQAGDGFSATLVKPLVVNGVVVAEPGQTLGGHVVEAVKAGRVEGVARLGVQITDLNIVDGQQLPIQSSLVSRTGPTTVGRDAAAIGGTTALGAIIGAAAGWGKGAAIGAGAGAAVGIIGVLVTRGAPSVLYPEQILTFRVEAPLTIATDRAPQAFRYVQPGEYDRPVYSQAPPMQGPGYYAGAAYPAPAPYYYGSPYPYYGYGYGYGYGYPYYGGPGFSLFLGGGRYYGGRYYGGYRYAGPTGRVYAGGGVAHFSGGGRR